MRALRIDPDATVTDINLPESDAQSAIRDHVGSPDAVDQGVYHRRAVLHLHGSGRVIGLDANLAAWALASAWRGTPLYPLHGTVVVTGRGQDGGVNPLDDELAQHGHTVAQTVRDTLATWRIRPPASNHAAVDELLAYATRDITPPRT
ncbi:hypothetical protein [Streptomyces sp. NBC_00989]|uniref:hypothetical protein n=1 Tax=Streptomyces sp. NBC_00989 TaxID=2903705 RepID=UPI002F912C8A|nr:hypothetical protein OG714_55160 [Streptomyces sp. NBC_00989]